MENKSHFSVGEIANLTGVSIRTFQYYDNIELVPLRKELTNGCRFYEEKDITKLQQVLFYKSLRLPIKEIKPILAHAVTNEEIASMLRFQCQVMHHQLNDMEMNIALIDTSIKNLEENNTPLSSEFLRLNFNCLNAYVKIFFSNLYKKYEELT